MKYFPLPMCLDLFCCDVKYINWGEGYWADEPAQVEKNTGENVIMKIMHLFAVVGLVYLIVKCKTPQLPILLWKCLREKMNEAGKPLTWQGIPVHVICFNIETLKPISIAFYWKVDCFTWWRLWGQYRSRLRKPEQTLQIGQCCQWSHSWF